MSKRKSHLRRGIAIAAAAVTAVAATVVTVQAFAEPSATANSSGCADQDRYTVCTTFPADGQPDTAIADEMARHINETDSGDSVKAAMYLWELTDDATDAPENVANALVDASQRGVDVRVVIGDVADLGDRDHDDWPNNPEDDRNRDFREIMTDNDIPLTECKDSCMDLQTDPMDRSGAMHNKFFLIQHGGSKNILQTSSNLSLGQVTDYQNMMVTRGDDALFDHLDQYWDRLDSKDWQGWGDEQRDGEGDHDLSKAYTFYRDSGDPVLERLNKVTECSAEHNRVWVAASMSGRDSIRDRLKELHDAGCDVRVIIHDTDSEAWLQSAGLPKAKVKDLPGNHNKLMMIDAKYSGEWRQAVFSGSHNHLDGGSSLLESNDVMFRNIHPGVFQACTEYFVAMYDVANA